MVLDSLWDLQVTVSRIDVLGETLVYFCRSHPLLVLCASVLGLLSLPLSFGCILPLFQYQMNSTRKMQEIQPSSKELQAAPRKILIVGPSFRRDVALYKKKIRSKTSSAFLSLDPDAGLDGLVPSAEPSRILF